jgi:hypothetical protein
MRQSQFRTPPLDGVARAAIKVIEADLVKRDPNISTQQIWEAASREPTNTLLITGDSPMAFSFCRSALNQLLTARMQIEPPAAPKKDF